MNLHRLLLERDAAGKPLRVGLIGAGKFGSMFLAQVRRTPRPAPRSASPISTRRARARALAQRRLAGGADRGAPRSAKRRDARHHLSPTMRRR